MLNSLDALRLTCNRCGHTWLRRSPAVPGQCPACKSAFWNKERKLAISEERKAEVRGNDPVKARTTTAAREAGKAGAGKDAARDSRKHVSGARSVRTSAAVRRGKRATKTTTKGTPKQ